MSQINAATLSAFLLTAIALYILTSFPMIPPWALFLAWACFFHMGGAERPRAVWPAAIIHMGAGALAAWLSALLLFQNPFDGELANALWAPIVIALAIALVVRLSLTRWLAVTSAVIYGYAAIWAYLSLPGKFAPEALLAFSFDNAAVAVPLAMLLGASCGYVNARLVGKLMTLRPGTAA